MMSFSVEERVDEPFDDGEPTGLTYRTATERGELRRLLLMSGLTRPAVPEDAPGVDVSGRLKLVDWPPVEAGSVAHRQAAVGVGLAALAG